MDVCRVPRLLASVRVARPHTFRVKPGLRSTREASETCRVSMGSYACSSMEQLRGSLSRRPVSPLKLAAQLLLSYWSSSINSLKLTVAKNDLIVLTFQLIIIAAVGVAADDVPHPTAHTPRHVPHTALGLAEIQYQAAIEPLSPRTASELQSKRA